MPTGPTGRSEESVQFSLKELLKLEDERLEEQERVKQVREAEASRERDENERRRRADAEAQARADAEAREQHRRGELEDLARREAMQKAVVEQARLEVEVRARAEEREHERRHEIAIARLRSESKKGQSIGALVGAAGLGGGIMLVVALGLELGVLKPAVERRVTELQLNVVGAESRVEDVGRQLGEQRRLLADRDRQLADARLEIEALKKDRKPPTTPPPPSRPGKLNPGTLPARAPAAQPDCQAGDPMCFSLKTGR
jgi:hypothetical protein